MPITNFDKDLHVIFGVGDMITRIHGLTYERDDQKIHAFGIQVINNLKGPQPLDESVIKENVELEDRSVVLSFTSRNDVRRMIQRLEDMLEYVEWDEEDR